MAPIGALVASSPPRSLISSISIPRHVLIKILTIFLTTFAVSGLAGNGEDDEGRISSVDLAIADLVDSVDFYNGFIRYLI